MMLTVPLLAAMEERAAGIQLVAVVGELGDGPLQVGSIASVLASSGRCGLTGSLWQVVGEVLMTVAS
jgi:hypothetical protein